MKKITTIILIFIVLCAGVFGYGYYSIYAPSVQKETIFTVPAGASVKTIAKALFSENLIHSTVAFELLARLQNTAHKVRSGEYLLKQGITPQEILTLFVTGEMRMMRITIPEGLFWWEVAKRFEDAGLVSFADFETLVYNTQFLQELGIPYSSAEGFLYPETYTFVKPHAPTYVSTKNVIKTMVSMFMVKMAGVFPPFYTKEQEYKAIILASIVEKEAQQIEERARIAGVYVNRINISMILQADPTIIYGLGPSFDGNLRKKDLQDKTNPYNTYQIQGLPPTPICSPSRGVVEAVLNPERHEYLYFVAIKKDGRHFFSRTLEEHNRAVQKYQIEQ